MMTPIEHLFWIETGIATNGEPEHLTQIIYRIKFPLQENYASTLTTSDPKTG